MAEHADARSCVSLSWAHSCITAHGPFAHVWVLTNGLFAGGEMASALLPYATANLEAMCESWEGYKNLGPRKTVWSRDPTPTALGLREKWNFVE